MTPIDPAAYVDLICLQKVPEPIRADIAFQIATVITKAVKAAGGKIAIRRECRNPACGNSFLVGVNARGVFRRDRVYCSNACKFAYRRACNG